MLYLITGANRGIGLGFVGQLLARGDSVVATARRPDEADELQRLAERHPDRLEIAELDLSRQDTIDEVADRLGNRSLDVLINNGATMKGAGPFEELNDSILFESFEVNTVGPLRVSRALLPNLERAEGAKIVNITSKMGSVADNTSGGSYAYRISKAALNMATRSMAIDLAPREIIAFVIHPGWVRTRMGGSNALIDTETSVSNMLRIIDGADEETSGTFQEWNGNQVPW